MCNGEDSELLEEFVVFDDDLRLVFNPKTYLPAIFDNPTGRKTTIQNPYYWIPILAILTGCRLEELCMMRCKDIMKVNGVWLYRIREEGEYGKEETRVKNHYSERDIPLHSVLRDTQILSFPICYHQAPDDVVSRN